jgi:hypothetical protein
LARGPEEQLALGSTSLDRLARTPGSESNHSPATHDSTLAVDFEEDVSVSDDRLQTARIGALASAVQLWEHGLRDDLAEFLPMTHILDGLYRAATAANEPWPGKSEPELRKAEVLRHRIILRLDPSIEPQRALMDALDVLRHETAKPWLKRRDAAVDAAVGVFRARWSDVNEHQT